MRRSLLLIASLTSAAALGGWYSYPVPLCSSRDVTTSAAGTVIYTCTTDVVGLQVWPDGGSAQLARMTGNYVGAGLTGGGCLVLCNVGGTVDYSAGCGASLTPGVGSFVRCELAPSGYLAITAGSGSSESLYYAPLDGGPVVLSGGVGGWAGALQRGLSYETIAGVELAIVPNLQGLLVRSVGRGPAANVSPGFVPRTVAVTTLSGFPSVASITTGSTLMFALLDAGAAATPLTPAQAPSACQFVTFTEVGGDPSGRGFGLVTTGDGGVHSPIPDPARPGMVWVQRPPSSTPALTGRVKCLDSSFCVATGPGASEVSAYFNEAPPSVLPPTGVLLVPGVPQVVSVVAADPDGDPVFLTWSGTGALVTADGGAEVGVTSTGATCSAPTVSLSYTISDGLASHVGTGTFVLPVQGLTGPAQPVITPLNPDVWPGGDAVQFTASVDGGGCPVTFAWTVGGQRTTGPTASYVPPATNCSADAGLVLVSVVAQDSVDASVPATTTITVRPWGVPDAPQFDGGTQVAGTMRLWTPTDLGNACATTAGFPGTALRWTRIATSGPSVTAEGQDGGLLVVSSDSCTGGMVLAQAVRHVVGSATESDAGSLAVSVVPDRSPIGPGTSFSMGFSYDPVSSRIGGDFSTSASCPSARGLSAEVQVLRDGGAVVADRTFQPVPGPWQLTVPGACNGGDFVAVARLFEDGGATGLEDRQAFRTPVLPVALDPVPVTPAELAVTCGVGGRGTLTAHPAPGTCQALEWTWRQVGGPALDGGALTGDSIEVQTVDTGFDLLGQALAFELSADAGAGNGVQQQVDVSFTTDPFLELEAELTPRPVREEESATVQVTVRNTKACDVHGVELRVTLAGLRPVAGSAQLEGQHVEATADGLVLRAMNVDVPARQTKTLRFRARPMVLSRVEVSAQAWVGTVLVSFAPPRPQGGCGCGAGAGGPLAFALLALLARRRRRGPAGCPSP